MGKDAFLRRISGSQPFCACGNLNWMSVNRIYLSQESVDSWLSEDRVSIKDDVITLVGEDRQFRLQSAVRFIAEVTGELDQAQLVGKVKDLGQIKDLNAEHTHDSVICGDNAYQVEEGFVGVPLDTSRRDHSTEVALLSKFFLSN